MMSTPRCTVMLHAIPLVFLIGGSTIASLARAVAAVSDAEDEGTGGGDKEDDDVLDDWQVTADALVDNTHNHKHFVLKEPPVAPVPCVEPAHAATRPEPIKTQRRAARTFPSCCFDLPCFSLRMGGCSSVISSYTHPFCLCCSLN